MSDIWSRIFWKDAIERAAKTAAQVLAAMLAAGQTSLLELDWQATLATVGTAAALSILTSVGSVRAGSVGTASLVPPGAPPDARDKDRAEPDEDRAEREEAPVS